MKKIVIFIVFCFSYLLFVDNVLAHPGRTDSSDCHKCNTNCAKWGLEPGEYHCHNENGYTNSKGQLFNSEGLMINEGTSSNSSNGSQEDKPSNTNSNTSGNSNTAINNDNPNNSSNENSNTNKNDNSTTNDNDKKSSNTNIKIIVDGEEIKFVTDKAEIHVDSNTTKLNYYYVLEDKKSKVSVNDVSSLKTGENEIIFKVVAQDGTERVYTLIVIKDEETGGIIETIVGLGALGGIGYGGYQIIKKKNR